MIKLANALRDLAEVIRALVVMYGTYVVSQFLEWVQSLTHTRTRMTKEQLLTLLKRLLQDELAREPLVTQAPGAPGAAYSATIVSPGRPRRPSNPGQLSSSYGTYYFRANATAKIPNGTQVVSWQPNYGGRLLWGEVGNPVNTYGQTPSPAKFVPQGRLAWNPDGSPNTSP